MQRSPTGESQHDIDDLIKALGSDDPGIRRNAALELGIAGEWRATRPLIAALADPVQGVREAAASALVMVGTPAVEPLIDLLDRQEASAEYKRHLKISREGPTQIDLLAGPEGIPPEKRTLQHRTLAQHDLFAGPAGVADHDALVHEAEEGARRAYAAAILGEIADPRAEEPLARALSDDDPVVRKSAGDALAKFHEKRGEVASAPPSW
ncbi:MAG: HEAT repeat domain-containing protein [Methanomicrobiales archaeon]|nr:HEAT repeat domain-containing protein [Methanomicrobiales archaeon]